jgi:glucokinase
MTLLLVADMGGTKTDFALVEGAAPGFAPVRQGRLANADFHSCAEVIAACLQGFAGEVAFASLAVAGPVVEQRVAFTNLPWRTGATELARELGLAGVLLANDLEALAHGVDLLTDSDLQVVKPAAGHGHGRSLVAAPGTGLGAAVIQRQGGRSLVQATEAGHLSFSPCTAEEEQLLAFLHRHHDHVSFEMVCSGRGLTNLAAFLIDCGVAAPKELATRIRQDHDLAAVLAGRALDPGLACPLSTRTFGLFIDILAEFCGNLAVAFMPDAALYLGGGMLPRLGPLFDHQRFCRRLARRGKMAALVAGLPVSLITHPHAALLGALLAGRRKFYDAG